MAASTWAHPFSLSSTGLRPITRPSRFQRVSPCLIRIAVPRKVLVSLSFCATEKGPNAIFFTNLTSALEPYSFHLAITLKQKAHRLRNYCHLGSDNAERP